MIETAWFYKYKPITIDDYVFETEEQRVLCNKWIQSGKIESNLLLYGPAGTGKTALAEILIKSILKSKLDLNKIASRSVKEIDQLEPWLQKKPVKSNSKIVYFEEFDRISNTAMDQLKDGLLEKYQQHVTFIATTNYIRKIPNPIQTRFTLKFNLTCSNIEGVTNRLKTILDTEKIQYNIDDLKGFVTNNIKLGLRDLINNIQSNTVNNVIDFQSINTKKSSEEEEVIYNTIHILKTILQIKDSNTKKMILINPLQSEIAQYYKHLLEIINLNKDLQYELILEELNDRINFIPLKLIINKYIDQFSYKRFPHITFLAFLGDGIKCMLTNY